MKILLFGATGTAGGAVLRACLEARQVSEVRALVRRPLAVQHHKLRIQIHHDYTDFAPAREQFEGVDACLYCLGISVSKVDAATYLKISHEFPTAAARALHEFSPNGTFHYISGAGTEARSRLRWARVKAAAEEELLGTFGAVCWRPAFIDAPQSHSAPIAHKVLTPVFRLLRPFSKLYVSGEDLGKGMIQAAEENWRGRIVENAEIRQLAVRFTAASEKS